MQIILNIEFECVNKITNYLHRIWTIVYMENNVKNVHYSNIWYKLFKNYLSTSLGRNLRILIIQNKEKNYLSIYHPQVVQ